MYPLFKFTLNNTVKGSEVVDDPEGWDEIAFILERDKEFSSIVEGVETPFMFSGAGRDYIIDVLDNQGADSLINLTIELSYNEGLTYDTIFEGILSLDQAEEQYVGTTSYKVKVPVMQNSFWQKFKNRFDTNVEIGSTTDLDGGTRQTIDKHDLTLTSQKVRELFSGDINGTTFSKSTGLSDSVDAYVIWNFDNIINNEIQETFNYSSQIVTTDPVEDNKYTFKFQEYGTFTVEIDQLTGQFDFTPTTWGGGNDYAEFIFKRVGPSGTSTQSLGEETTATGIIGYVKNNVSKTFSIQPGDEIYIYARATADTFNYLALTLWGDSTTFKVTFDVTKPATSCESYLIHDAFHSSCNMVTGQNNSFYSEFLGNRLTQLKSYASDGDGSHYALMKGVNVRQKPFSEKPFSASIKKLWDGANPIFNLGLGYEEISGTDVIRVEVKEHFYDNDPHTTLSNINRLVRVVDDQKYIKSVEIGYKKWKSEAFGALDDPQSKHSYSTRFKTFGRDMKLLSEFYAASIGIEVTRRRSLSTEDSREDWKLDDEIMIIALNRDLDSSPPLNNLPELDEDFTSITNLINKATRYNSRLTPTRALLRWLNYLSSGLIKYPGEDYTFQGGEGNYDMASQLASADRGDNSLINISEKTDVTWDFTGTPFKPERDPILTGNVYEFDYPLSYSQYLSFKNNRKRSFNISASDTGHFAVFLQRLEWVPSKGFAKFRVEEAYA